jgi:hypothetical protein
MNNSLKEKIRYWFEFLRLAHESKDPIVVNALRSNDVYEKWGDYRSVKFNSWWSSHSSLFKNEQVLSIPQVGEIVDSEFFYVKIPFTYAPTSVGKNLRAKNKDPLFFDIDTDTVIIDRLSSQSLANAKAQLARLSIPGYGFGQGDPRIAPWRTVEVRGTGESSDGFWVVSGAVHTLNADGKYTVEFEVATDGSGSNIASAFRPSSAGNVPTVNLTQAITTGANKPTAYKLSNSAPMVNQTLTGYNVAPRRWVAV